MKPIVKLEVKQKYIPFEFDTGSAVTIMCKNTFDNYLHNHDYPLERSNKVIRVANGGLVHDVYKCKVPVSHKSGEPQAEALLLLVRD